MSAPSTHAFALGLGVGGALIDVSDYVLFNEGNVTYKWGQDRRFDDPVPGTFSFTLKNEDGRFTPDNPTSPYPLTLVEGMQVVWEIEGRLVEGTIRAGGIQIIFPTGGNADSARVRVTCDDGLGNHARTQVDSLRAAYIDATAHAHWEFSNSEGTTEVAERINGASPMTIAGPLAAVDWGTPSNDGYESAGMRVSGKAFTSATIVTPDDVTCFVGLYFRVLTEPSALSSLIVIETSVFGRIEYKVGRPSAGVPDQLSWGGLTANITDVLLGSTEGATVGGINYLNIAIRNSGGSSVSIDASVISLPLQGGEFFANQASGYITSPGTFASTQSVQRITIANRDC